MKTLARILIILVAFGLIMGIAYVVVNATSSSTSAPAFERGGESFARPDGLQSPFRNGERPEFGGARPRGGDWMFGLVKNIGIIAIIVALIVVPKSFRHKKAAPVRVD